MLQEECRVSSLRAAPSYSEAITGRVSGGNTDFWEVFGDREFAEVLIENPWRFSLCAGGKIFSCWCEIGGFT